MCNNSGCGARRNDSPVVQAERVKVQPLERGIQSQHETSVIPGSIYCLRPSVHLIGWRSRHTDGLGPASVTPVADRDLGQLHIAVCEPIT